MLAMTKRLTVLKCDITQAVANQEAFNARMSYWTQLHEQLRRQDHRRWTTRSSSSTRRWPTSTRSIMTQYQLVAAAAGVPATKLLGTQPEGLQRHRRVRGGELPRGAGEHPAARPVAAGRTGTTCC